MNAFDKLMALGIARTRAVNSQEVTIGAVAGVEATVSPIRREQRVDTLGNPVWVDAGDVTIGRDVWPEAAPLPVTGQQITLADGTKFRVGPVSSTPALISLNFTSLY